MNFVLQLAQVQIQERSGEGCVASNGFCPDWIADNFDRYIDPFWQHVYLVLVSVGIGFAVSFALAVIAHRQRWLTGPDHRLHRRALHDPQHRRVHHAAAASPGAGTRPRSSRSCPTRCW